MKNAGTLDENEVADSVSVLFFFQWILRLNLYCQTLFFNKFMNKSQGFEALAGVRPLRGKVLSFSTQK